MRSCANPNGFKRPGIISALLLIVLTFLTIIQQWRGPKMWSHHAQPRLPKILNYGYTQNCYSLVCWSLPRFLRGRLLSPLTMQVALMALGLISTQPIVEIQQSCWLFFQKVLLSSWLLTSSVTSRGTTWSICTRIIEYSLKHPFPLLPQSSVQKGGLIFGSLWYYDKT